LFISKNVSDTVKRFPETTDRAKIHDIDAINAEKNLINILLKKLSRRNHPIVSWANRTATVPVTTASDGRMFGVIKIE